MEIVNTGHMRLEAAFGDCPQLGSRSARLVTAFFGNRNGVCPQAGAQHWDFPLRGPTQQQCVEISPACESGQLALLSLAEVRESLPRSGAAETCRREGRSAANIL